MNATINWKVNCFRGFMKIWLDEQDHIVIQTFYLFIFSLACLDCLLCFRQREPFHDIIIYFCISDIMVPVSSLSFSPLQSINQSINHRKAKLPVCFILFCLLPHMMLNHSLIHLTHSFTIRALRYGTNTQGGFPSFFVFNFYPFPPSLPPPVHVHEWSLWRNPVWFQFICQEVLLVPVWLAFHPNSLRIIHHRLWGKWKKGRL